MYAKLFSQMFDGTLVTRGPWEALVTFQQLLILCDQHGVIDATPEVIARRTTIPLDIIRKGLEELERPDPHSRSPDEEGRRIVRLSDSRPWGWRIVNYVKYRKIRSQEERREYHRRYWFEKRSRKAKAKAREPKGATQPNTQQLNHDSTNSTNSSKQYAVSRKQKAVKTAAVLPPSPGQATGNVNGVSLPSPSKAKGNGAQQEAPSSLQAWATKAGLQRGIGESEFEFTRRASVEWAKARAA
jgi:hypothetical protein